MLIINKIFRLWRRKYARQVHAECYYIDKVWDCIINSNGFDKLTWYVMTPANYELIKQSSGTIMSKEQLGRVMGRRLREMKAHGYNLQLHVHFWRELLMPFPKKCQLLSEALAWGKKNSIEFTEMVPGWFKYDDDLPRLCDKFGIKLVGREACIHDYELVR